METIDHKTLADALEAAGLVVSADEENNERSTVSCHGDAYPFAEILSVDGGQEARLVFLED